MFLGYKVVNNADIDYDLIPLTTVMAQQSDNITMAPQWARWRLKSPTSPLFTQPFVQVLIKEYIKASRHCPLWGESTGDRWIPRTKGQLRGKYFHFMTSSGKPTLLTGCPLADAR